MYWYAKAKLIHTKTYPHHTQTYAVTHLHLPYLVMHLNKCKTTNSYL